MPDFFLFFFSFLPVFCCCKVVSCNGADQRPGDSYGSITNWRCAVRCCCGCSVQSSVPRCSGGWSGRVSPALPWAPPAGCCAGCSRGPGVVRLLLTTFEQVPGSHRVLIKYTDVVAVVARPQLLGPVGGSGVALNHPWARGSWEVAGRFPSGLPCLVGAGLGRGEDGLRKIPQLQRALWKGRRLQSGRISPRSSFVQGGRKRRWEKMR